MNSFALPFGSSVVGAAIIAVAFQTRADQVDSASCGAMTIADQCRISWSFSRSSNSYYFVQQFDPLAATGSEDVCGKAVYASINKKEDWLTQVIQYNVYQLVNAIARAKITDLPDMTPVTDIRVNLPEDPIEQVQFNVYWVYSAEQGRPIDSPMPKQVPRGPHEQPERHPQ